MKQERTLYNLPVLSYVGIGIIYKYDFLVCQRVCLDSDIYKGNEGRIKFILIPKRLCILSKILIIFNAFLTLELFIKRLKLTS